MEDYHLGRPDGSQQSLARDLLLIGFRVFGVVLLCISWFGWCTMAASSFVNGLRDGSCPWSILIIS